MCFKKFKPLFQQGHDLLYEKAAIIPAGREAHVFGTAQKLGFRHSTIKSQVFLGQIKTNFKGSFNTKRCILPICCSGNTCKTRYNVTIILAKTQFKITLGSLVLGNACPAFCSFLLPPNTFQKKKKKPTQNAAADFPSLTGLLSATPSPHCVIILVGRNTSDLSPCCGVLRNTSWLQCRFQVA